MRGVRFISQITEFDCGPIALMNILKALKRKVSYSNIKKYRKLLKCENREGVYPSLMEATLKKLKIKYFKRVNKKVTLGSIDKNLKKGYFALFLFAWDKEDIHYILITETKGRLYTVINYGYTSVATITRTRMKRLIKTKAEDSESPSILWIKKDQK